MTNWNFFGYLQLDLCLFWASKILSGEESDERSGGGEESGADVHHVVNCWAAYGNMSTTTTLGALAGED